MFFSRRGETFRKEYARLGEMRSILRADVNVMALTATATKQLRTSICETLGMTNHVLVSVPPDKANIGYFVAPFKSVTSSFGPIAEQLLELKTSTPRCVIFCQTLGDCPMLYRFFREYLGAHFTYPQGSRDQCGSRLVDMFHSCTEPCVKESIIASLTSTMSPLRVLIATVAFGLGIDISDIRTIIHFGASEDVESYVQAVGRAGRDGSQASAMLFVRKGGRQHINDQMKLFTDNTSFCRRKILFRGYDYSCPPSKKCLCCDVCAKQCKCGHCGEGFSRCVDFSYALK